MKTAWMEHAACANISSRSSHAEDTASPLPAQALYVCADPFTFEDCRLVGRDLIASVVIMERLMLSILHLALEGVSTVIFPPTQVCSNSCLPLDLAP